VQRDHTYDRRFEEILADLTGRVVRRSHHPIDWVAFEAAAKQHHLSPGLKMIRSFLVSAASMVFGKRRGPRAARRLAFELSWRLRGVWTYSAAGWPGRLFYHES
jgi:spore maturation protein CgeB